MKEITKALSALAQLEKATLRYRHDRKPENRGAVVEACGDLVFTLSFAIARVTGEVPHLSVEPLIDGSDAGVEEILCALGKSIRDSIERPTLDTDVWSEVFSLIGLIAERSDFSWPVVDVFLRARAVQRVASGHDPYAERVLAISCSL